jgi:hypothetical protein
MAKAKQRVPRMGTPDWSALVGVTARISERLRPALANPEATMPILQSDAAWLADLLNAIIGGEDVSKRFHKVIGNRARADEWHQYMAMDLKRLKHEQHEDPLGAVAKRWNMSSPSSVSRTLSRKKISLDALPLVHENVIEHLRQHARKRRTKAR